MARKEIVTVVDDIDGTTTEGVEPVHFYDLTGKRRVIDLSPENRADLEQALKEAEQAIAGFVESSRPADKGHDGGKKPGRKPAAKVDPEQSAAIREWARGNGWPELKNRGRIPAPVLEAYHAGAGNTAA